MPRRLSPRSAGEAIAPVLMSTNKNKYQNQKKRLSKVKMDRFGDLERIAEEMDTICRDRLPNGKIRNGALMGREPEIRQLALIKAVGGFLQKNHGYINAKKSNDHQAVKLAMDQCAAQTLRFSKLEIAREVTTSASRCTQINERNGGMCPHSSDLQPSDWPIDIKVGVVKVAVARAVREGRLSLANAGVVEMVCDQSLSVTQAAQNLGVTPPAIYQQLWRVQAVAPGMMELTEPSWQF